MAAASNHDSNQPARDPITIAECWRDRSTSTAAETNKKIKIYTSTMNNNTLIPRLTHDLRSSKIMRLAKMR